MTDVENITISSRHPNDYIVNKNYIKTESKYFSILHKTISDILISRKITFDLFTKMIFECLKNTNLQSMIRRIK